MGQGTNKIIPGETPQDNAGTQPAGTTPDPATGDGHPNPQRAASDAAEAATGKAPAKTKPAESATPKVSEAIVKAGRVLLKSNAALAVVYMTSDGIGFAEKNDAENHARGLKNKAVTPVKR